MATFMASKRSARTTDEPAPLASGIAAVGPRPRPGCGSAARPADGVKPSRLLSTP